MERVEFNTSSTPKIIIDHVGGNLRIKGWDRSAIRADCDSEEGQKFDQNEDTFSISTSSECMLRIPMESTLQIGTVDGDLMIKSSEGQISAENINGQIMAKSVGSMNLSNVGASINAKGLEGDFICNLAHGNVNLQDVEGNVKINHANGNLVIKGFCGSINSQVDGNTTLKIDTLSEEDYHMKSQGNITCRFEPEVDAVFTLKSDAEQISVQQDQSVDMIKSSSHQFVSGEGAKEIALHAGGNIDLVIPGDNEFDWEFELNLEKDISDMAENITMVVTDQLENQLDALGDHLNSLSDNLSNLNPEISDKTRARIEAKRAKLERKLAKVERRAADKARQTTRRVTRKYTISTPKSDPVSDEERQKVLEMLQNKLISVEDAEALLAALEGKN